jgi:hypothetical protein
MAAVAGIRSAHATLVANTEDVVTLSAGKGLAELCHHGGSITDVIYYRLDNTAVVKAADETYVCLPGERVSVNLADTGILRLISNGAAGYSVQLI